MHAAPHITHCDLIGDLHGCYYEWLALLDRLGYVRTNDGGYQHSAGHTLVLVGDLTDRGPMNVAVLKLAMRLYRSGTLLLVRGNHDDKLARALAGRKVITGSGLARTLREITRAGEAFTTTLRRFLEELPLQLSLDHGRLLVVHAGIRPNYIGKSHDAARAFCLFGETTGRTDATGFPERLDWTRNHPGTPYVVYGHTPRNSVYFNNNTAGIDTGCVFGNTLTALRYPELTTVSVPAARVYSGVKPQLIRAGLK